MLKENQHIGMPTSVARARVCVWARALPHAFFMPRCIDGSLKFLLLYQRFCQCYCCWRWRCYRYYRCRMDTIYPQQTHSFHYHSLPLYSAFVVVCCCCLCSFHCFLLLTVCERLSSVCARSFAYMNRFTILFIAKSMQSRWMLLRMGFCGYRI